MTVCIRANAVLQLRDRLAAQNIQITYWPLLAYTADTSANQQWNAWLSDMGLLVPVMHHAGGGLDCERPN